MTERPSREDAAHPLRVALRLALNRNELAWIAEIARLRHCVFNAIRSLTTFDGAR